MSELDKYKRALENFKEKRDKTEIKILISADRFNRIAKLDSGTHEVLQYLREFLVENPDEELITLLKDQARVMVKNNDLVSSEYINVLSNFIYSIHDCMQLIDYNNQHDLKQYSFTNMKISNWVRESKDYDNIHNIIKYLKNKNIESVNKALHDNLIHLLYMSIKDDVKQGLLFYSLIKGSNWKNFNSFKFAELANKAKKYQI